MTWLWLSEIKQELDTFGDSFGKVEKPSSTQADNDKNPQWNEDNANEVNTIPER